MSRRYRRLGLLIALSAGALAPAWADTLSDGYIGGEIVAVSGEHLADARVWATNTETGNAAQAISDSRGTFRLPLLPPGRYRVSASLPGFSDTGLEGVVVKASAGTHVVIAMRRTGQDESIDEIEVVASSISKIDVLSNESVITLDETKLDTLPTIRDGTAVALLTPGAVGGSEFFDNFDQSGRFASFGGASVAENSYYINGMNVTDFRKGLGGSGAPFEFFREFQVKYSGISAEYGRATGGFVSAQSKRGGNEFEYGIGAYYQPNDLVEKQPDVYAENGNPVYIGSLERRTSSEAYVYASGPVIRDKLFFYGIYNARDTEDVAALTTYRETVADDPFWGVKLDYELNADHALEFTAFSDATDYVRERYDFDPATREIGDSRGRTIFKGGSETWIAKYSGYFGREFTVSMLAGHSEGDRGSSSDGDAYPVIYDNRAPNFFKPLGSFTNNTRSRDADERDLGRLDLEWRIGRHLLRAGVDYEFNTAFSETSYSGDIGWIYFDVTPGQELFAGTVPDGVTQAAQELVFRRGGSFDSKTTSWYLEDSWQIRNDLLLNIGIRNETFDNRNANGETYLKISDQWAPRVGAVWDVFDDQTTRLYASYGRYYLPLASAISLGLAGSDLSTESWYVLEGLNPDDTPQLGAQIGETAVWADGEIRDTDSLIDRSIEPMYQDEWALGLEREFGDDFVAGISIIRRDLIEVIEDISLYAALSNYAAENGYPDYVPPGLGPYVLTNPGTDMQIRIDLDGDGIPEDLLFTADELGMPKAERKYTGVNLYFERVWDGAWFMRADYTWSKSYGNFEGAVDSDWGSSVPGFTSKFDFPGLMEFGNGDLPNDRRHVLKVYGAWQFRPSWTVSANASWSSGKPRNTFSIHPADDVAALYGASSFFTPEGEPKPRGTTSRMASIGNIDLSLLYERSVFDSANMVLQVDVFNVFNQQGETLVREATQFDNGDADLRFGLPQSFQAPRSVRFSFRLDFK